MKMLCVKWRDSHRYIEQMEDASEVNIVLIETVGFLVNRDKSMIVLAQDYIEGDWRGVIAIPKENIIEILEITGLEKEKI